MNDDCEELVVVVGTVESSERDVAGVRSGVAVDASTIGSGDVFDLIRAMAAPFMDAEQSDAEQSDAEQSERGVDAMLRARRVGAESQAIRTLIRVTTSEFAPSRTSSPAWDSVLAQVEGEWARAGAEARAVNALTTPAFVADDQNPYSGFFAIGTQPGDAVMANAVQEAAKPAESSRPVNAEMLERIEMPIVSRVDAKHVPAKHEPARGTSPNVTPLQADASRAPDAAKPTRRIAVGTSKLAALSAAPSKVGTSNVTALNAAEQDELSAASLYAAALDIDEDSADADDGEDEHDGVDRVELDGDDSAELDGDRGLPDAPAISRVNKPRIRTKRTRPRSKTIAMKRLTRAELQRGAVANPPVEGIERPLTRAECATGMRPCPWVACKHHLYLDINPRTGSIKINFPDLEPWELQHTCALDVADNGGLTLEEIGLITNLTRERVRQVEVRGLITLKTRSNSLK